MIRPLLPLVACADVRMPPLAVGQTLRMNASTDPSRALVFGEVAGEYARHRPSYPDEAVAWLTGGAQVVAELGAGTGQLTAKMLAMGIQVHAVEPDERMLAVLTHQHPAVHGYCSTADEIPLTDHSVDAVLSADAWHWFPEAETVKEVRRVLRPGGWLGLVWNTPAPVAPWEYELAGIDPDKKSADGTPTSPVRSGFGPFPDHECEREIFPWAWSITPERFRSYLATNSALITMSTAEREDKLDSSAAVVRAACEEATSTSVPLNHVAACFRWRPGR